MMATTYTFTAAVTGLDLDNEKQLEALEHTPDTFLVLPAIQNRAQLLSCSIPATSAPEAIRILAKFINSNTREISLVTLVPDLVNMTQIAEELGKSRETVRLWDKHGHNNFPVPFSTIANPARIQPVWVWGDIYAWATQYLPEAELNREITPFTSSHIVEANNEINECKRKLHLETTWRNHRDRVPHYTHVSLANAQELAYV